ncbi:MAG: SAM-dependent methyltransferase [Rhodospirillales bacterium]|nr:SAM-dependent methyltransferase [Rhodospirillales bacterium]
MERLDRFMARANAAYYATRDPFADFATAPEISQVFGEILGLWAAIAWRDAGRPAPALLAEAGPGRGTLMADALRAIRRAAPDFAAAVTVHLIETSPRLRAVQAATLADAGAVWHDKLDTLPDAPIFLLANEFLDALPVRHFVRRGDGWTERYVADGIFVEREAEPPPEGTVEDGAVREICLPARAFAAALGRRIAAQGGAALLIDYATDTANPGGSLQAIRDGAPSDPLVAPGSADLTAHVDFAAFAASARAAGVAVHGPVAQGTLLLRLGLAERTARLARDQPPDRAALLEAAARRLAAPHRMGRLFRALALTRAGAPPPPGFDPA